MHKKSASSTLGAPVLSQTLPAPSAPSAPVARTVSVQVAHDAIDKALAMDCFAHVENPAELVIVTSDELYCITRFRQMVATRQGEMTKNFIRGFDRLCAKS
jgi:hypothetical protein